MVKGIHHICMKCGTPEEFNRVKDFYVNVLGLTIFREWAAGVLLDTGSGYIEVFNNEADEKKRGIIRHVALLVDDVDEMVAKVKAAGYEVFVEPDNRDIPSEPIFPIRMAFCYGPLGEEIEFFYER